MAKQNQSVERDGEQTERFIDPRAEAAEAKITRFKKQAQHFEGLRQETVANAPRVPPEWQSQYHRILNKGNDIRSRIESTTRAVDSAYRYGQQVYGLDREGLGQLGILPLVPWAVISAGGAAMSYFANDAITFNKKLDELERLQEMGYTREEALQILEKPRNANKASGMLYQVWSNPIGKVALTGAGAWAAWKIANKAGWI